MIRETAYREVLHSQKHFRSLLDSFARPGKVNSLHPVPVTPPPGLNQAAALVAFALLDAAASFHTVEMSENEPNYLAANTNARPSTIKREAQFVFSNGAANPDFLHHLNPGSLLYPDTSATVVLILNHPTPALKLTLQGPGIDGATTLSVQGLDPALLEALATINSEFPIGLDLILALPGPAVAALPRTAKIAWEPV